MKKFVLFCLALLMLSASAAAQQVPEKIILHNVLNNEFKESKLDKFVKAKKDTPLYLTADESSTVIATISAEQTALVRGYELHTSPRLNPYLLTKKVKGFTQSNPHIQNLVPAVHDEIYFLSPRGDGYFQAWWKGNIIWLKPTYPVSIYGSQLWLCLVHPESGLEGWTPVVRADWYTTDSEMFFDDAQATAWAI